MRGIKFSFRSESVMDDLNKKGIFKAVCVRMLLLTLSSTFFVASFSARAEMVVIVNEKNQNAMSRRQVARLFLDRSSSFPDGTRAKAINMPDDSLMYSLFARQVLKKTPRELKRYWAKKSFNGAAIEPETVSGGQKRIVEYVKNHPGAIAYVDSSLLEVGVRVLKLR